MTTKKILDLSLTVPALILLTPLFIIIAILIKLDSPGPILFRQIRVGQHKKNFKIFKFRTMYSNSEKEGQLTIGDDKRITKIGRWLRRYKLDELPQLLNVIKGEMSLVGPRAEVPQYIKYYPQKSCELIFTIPPGITDPASIKFINENKMLAQTPDPEKIYVEKILPKKIESYEEYAKNHSTKLDFKIIIHTLFAIFSK